MSWIVEAIRFLYQALNHENKSIRIKELEI